MALRTMLFTSYTFLFVFLPVALTVAWMLRPPARNLWLAFASLLFYGCWRVDFLCLLLGSTVLNFVGGLIIDRREGRGRALSLSLFITLNLGVLAYFKYSGFGVNNLNLLLDATGWGKLGWQEVVLPIGISFYTFQGISYLVDVHRKTVGVCRSWIDYTCYHTLFPQLVAGPIVRYSDVVRELHRPAAGFSVREQGMFLFMLGFCKKVLLANNLGPVADAVFSGKGAGALDAWIGLTAYALQIYFDFSGYSDMAIGLGLLLGFKFPLNFNSPYKSASITDFWRRWHMTLSHWLKDYLYIPLGGNRHGKARTCLNLMLVMLLGGFWHGANWTFILWGGFHGFWLVAERFRGGKSLLEGRVPAFANRLFILLLILLSWIPFRTGNLHELGTFLARLSGAVSGDPFLPTLHQAWFWLVLGASAVIALVFPNSQELAGQGRRPLLTAAVFVLFVLALHEIYSQELNPFLYFQF
jgi:alginate O-acetyltransferase complex protein AlgI